MFIKLDQVSGLRSQVSTRPSSRLSFPPQVWSPYQQPDSLGDLEGRVEDKSRSLYTHEEYISLVLNSGSGLSHDYVSQSIQEDPRMMAFFDSLVRREIEGWSSDSDSDLSEEAIMQLHARGRRSTRAATAAPAAAAAASASAADHHSDSDNSSSSSLAGPDASGGEEQAGEQGEERPRRRSTHQRHPSGFRVNEDGLLVNEDSDSSEFWLDPMPRPRSPSPRDNSTLSSPTSSPSLPAGASSSSTSTSSSSSDDEERRSAVRRRNVVRRRRMHVVSRAGDRPESVQALFSALDSCSYPSISVDDLSSSSSGEEQSSLPIKPRTRTPKEDDKSLSPSDFVCPSPVMSPESQDNEDSRDGRPARSGDVRRTEGGQPATHGSDGAAACSSSQSRRSPELNGQHRPESETRHASSEPEDKTGDARPRREKDPTGTGLKRTRVAAGQSGSSPSEKKLKT